MMGWNYQNEIKNSLKDFTSNDYLLLYGDPAIIGVVCAVASDITNGKFKLLKFDRRQFSYYPIELNIFQNQLTIKIISLYRIVQI